MAALGGTALTALAAVAGSANSRVHRLVGAAATAGYAAMVGRAQHAAFRDPSARTVRAATKAGIHGMVLLQSALAARRQAPAAALALILPLARALSRKVTPT